MTLFFYAITALGSVAGALLLIFTLVGSQSAPQQAAGAALAIGLAVIPYVFSRCVQILVSESRRRNEVDRLIDKLDQLERAIEKGGAYETPKTIRVAGEIA